MPTPLPQSAVAIAALLLIMYIPSSTHAQTAIALTNGDAFNNIKYTAAVTFDANANLKDEKSYSSTITWKSCSVSSNVTIKGTFDPNKDFPTSLYFMINATSFSGVGQFYFHDLPPNSYIHAVGSTGSNAQATTFDIRPTTESNNITTFVDASTVAYDVTVKRIQLINLAVPDSSPYIVTHMRNAKLTGAFTIFQTTTCTKGSTIFLEKITCTMCRWDLIYLNEITSLSEQSAIILKEISILGHTRSLKDGLLRTNDFLNVDASSVLAVIDIDLTDNFSLASPLRLFFGIHLSGTGTIVFLRIKMGPSGLDSLQPEDNSNFWVIIKNKSSRTMTTAELRDANFSVNTKNVINWDGTGADGKCVQAGLALPNTATYELVGGQCVATCPQGNYLPPACTPRAVCTGVPNCLACYAHPKDKCLECLSHTTPENNDTLCRCPIPDCLECPSPTLCTNCTQGYIFSPEDNSCFHCIIDNCALCRGNDKCSTCEDGYSLYNNQCIACNIQSCLSCQEAGKCHECIADYKPTSDAISCFHCTIPNCAECSADGVCGECDVGYLLVPSTTPTEHKCLRCQVDIPQCKTCEVDSICSECNADYKLANGGTACFNCTIPDCAECSADGVCGECEEGYLLVVSPSTPTENKCVRCTIDIPQCKSCEVDSICSECNTDYKPTIQGTACFICDILHCADCRADEVCELCDEGYSLVQSPSAPTDNKCVRCNITNCDACKSDGVCSTCADGGYTLSPDGLRCTLCNVDGCQRCDLPDICSLCNEGMTTTDDGHCTPCNIANCTHCSEKHTCAACTCGLSPSGNGKKCVPCGPSHCSHCDPLGGGAKCAQCRDDYDVTGSGTCTKSSLPQLNIFLIVLSVTMLILVALLVANILYKRRLVKAAELATDKERRRRNRRYRSNAHRPHLEIACIDLGDLEGAASGVRDKQKTQVVTRDELVY